jgi:hypothetical protein
MKTQRGFAPILIIFLIALIIGGTYYSIQKKKTRESSSMPQSAIDAGCKDTTDDCGFVVLPIESKSQIQATSTISTKDWKTYTNTEFGFSFKYPSKYVATENCNCNKTDTGDVVIVTTKSELSNNEFVFGIWKSETPVGLYAFDDDLEIQNFTNLEQIRDYFKTKNNVAYSKTIFSGKTAYTYSSLDTIKYELQYKEHYFRISQTRNEAFQNVSNQITASFVFTK